jgi:hypothetical protein
MARQRPVERVQGNSERGNESADQKLSGRDDSFPHERGHQAEYRHYGRC